MTIFNDLFEVTNEFFANEMWTKISEMPVIVWKYFSQFPNKWNLIHNNMIDENVQWNVIG